MKKLFISTILFSLFSFSVFCGSGFTVISEFDEPSFTISVEPIFGLRNGAIGEYVFLKEPIYDDPTLSYLDWQIKSELYCGAKIATSVKQFFADATFKVGLPSVVGKMEDWDWFNNDITYNPNKIQTINYKTNFSQHDNHLESDFIFDFNFGYKFNITQKFSIHPSLGVSYSKIQFSGQEGYLRYGNENLSKKYYYPYDSNNFTTQELNGTVINYMREKVSIFIGSNFVYSPIQDLFLSVNFQVAPYTYTINLDNHFVPAKDFADIGSAFFADLKLGAQVEYQFTKNFFASFNFEFNRLCLIDIPNYVKQSHKTKFNLSENTTGGADATIFDYSISCKYKFSK